MKLEIKEIGSTVVHEIGPEGAILGRGRSGTDIVVRGGSVSKQHARIFHERGGWYLEDLGSSNGTYIGDKVVADPVPLAVGSNFSLGKKQFQVVYLDLDMDDEITRPAPPTYEEQPSPTIPMEEDSNRPTTPGLAGDTMPQSQPAAQLAPEEPEPRKETQQLYSMNEDEAAELLAEAAPAPVASQPETVEQDATYEERPEKLGSLGEGDDKPGGGGAEGYGEVEGGGHGGGAGGGGDAGGGGGGGGGGGDDGYDDGYDDVPSGDEIASKGVGYFFIALPKALAWFFGAAMVMIFNPIGTINKSVNEQKHEAKAWLELSAYAMAAIFITMMMGTICAMIAALVHLAFGAMVTALIGGIIFGAIGGVVGGLITGLIFHPVIKWLVNLLKGTSDARSRTNYFMVTMTVMVVLSIPNGLAGVIGGIPWINLIAPIISLAASLIMLYLLYTWWMKGFKVADWFKWIVIVIGVLMILGALGGIYSMIQISRAGGAVSAAANVEAAMADAMAAMEGLSDEQKAAAAAAGGAAKAAQALALAAGAEGAEAAKAIAAAQAAAAKAAQAGKEADEAEESGEAGEAEEAIKEAVEEAEEAAKPPPVKVAAAPVKVARAAPPPPRGASRWLAYMAKRDAIDKAIADDPHLLKSRKIYLEYEKLLKVAGDIAKKYAKKSKKKAWKTKLNNRMRDMAILKKTSELVDKLYGRIYE